ncbi:MAG: hypothetical protein J6I49_02405 [Bacteroidales bacterium]|nr:hypothetical protein [Bacteroidales bacterium]
MSGKNIRKLLTYGMLVLYLTLVGLTAVHRHYQPADPCTLCSHHSKHYHSTSQSVHDCQLCHFMSIPCLLAGLTLTVCAANPVVWRTAPCARLHTASPALLPARAPPLPL